MTSLAPSLPALRPEPRYKVVRWGGANPIFGPLREIQDDNLGTFLRMSQEGDAISFRVMHQRLHLLTHPDHFRHVLVDRVKNYQKKTRGYRLMKKMVRNGLLTSEGAYWQRQRRLAAPAFHKHRIAAFGDTMVRIATETRDHWTNGATIDVAHEMMEATLRIVTLTLLSRDSIGEATRVGDALSEGLSHITYRTLTPWAPPEWVPTPGNRRFNRAVQTLDEVVFGIIAERRKTGPNADGRGEDLLDMLIGSVDEETGEQMTDEGLRDEILTIMLAGHETTAMSLTWTLHLLAQNPEIEAALLAEIDSVLGGRTATMTDALPYADRVVQESMRLYPPAWIVARRAAAADTEIDGVDVREGDWVFLSPFVTHRRADFWPEPERFDPDRFLPERVAARHRYAWMPFIAGQRKCIGDQFALMEARLILVTLLQQWRFRAAPGHIAKPEPLLTLRPAGGMPMILERRLTLSERSESKGGDAPTLTLSERSESKGGDAPTLTLSERSESKGGVGESKPSGRCPFGHG